MENIEAPIDPALHIEDDRQQQCYAIYSP